MDAPRKHKILIIDDDAAIVEIVSKTLEDAGYEAASAMNGRNGLEQIGRLAPSLILLDQNMPDLTGAQILGEIKKNPRTGNIPVIMLTADHTAATVSASLELGACDYIAKPFDPHSLILRVRNALKKQA